MSERLRIAAVVALVVGSISFLCQWLLVPPSATGWTIAINVTMIMLIALLPPYIIKRRSRSGGSAGHTANSDS
jgi:hypothetical protein